jgi:hypothetical protein
MTKILVLFSHNIGCQAGARPSIAEDKGLDEILEFAQQDQREMFR